MYNKSELWNMEMEKTEKTVQPGFPTVRLGFLIPNSVYFTLCHIFTFQYAAHFCTDHVQLHWSICQAMAVRDCGNQHAGKVFQKCPKALNSADFHKSLPQGNFCLFGEIQWNQQTLFLWREFQHCRSARMGVVESCKQSKGSDSWLSYLSSRWFSGSSASHVAELAPWPRAGRQPLVLAAVSH